MMTTIGVLGTFVGIMKGLAEFDVQHINESIPALLDGLKTAFVTSAVGMIGAILFKAIQLTVEGGRGTAPSAVGPADILAALKDIESASLRSGAEQVEAVTRLRAAIASDGDGSLLTQIQKVRTTLQDGQEAQLKEFRTFAAAVAEMGSKALIEALKEVIQDFNAKITEQFGDNFKRLNEAVGAMVAWQDRYRTHVEELEARHRAAMDGLAASEASLGAIATHSARIPETMEALGALLTEGNRMLAELEARLAAVAGLRDKALEAFPVIEGNIRQLTEGFAGHVVGAVAAARQSLADQQASYESLAQGFDGLRLSAVQIEATVREEAHRLLAGLRSDLEQQNQLHGQLVTEMAGRTRDQFSAIADQFATSTKAVVQTSEQALQLQLSAFKTLEGGYRELKDNTEQVQDTFRKQLDKALEEMGRELQKALTQQGAAVDAAAKQMERITAEAWERTQTAMNKQIEALDAQLQKELERAITALGQPLASLSEKFVADYAPLTDRLREVVRMAEAGR